MANIIPFCGLIYNQDKISDMSLVVAPPYDVISEKERVKFYESHPYNILNIDLGPKKEQDNHPYRDWHKRSAQILEQWQNDKILLRSDKPTIYYLETDFRNPANGKMETRQGFVALLKLEDFGPNSTIKPHEQTFSDHKDERFSLMSETKAQLSQIFGFFSDPEKKALKNMEKAKKSAPDYDLTETGELTNRMWCIDNEDIINELTEILKKQTVYIADGHHRYDTALNYRNKRLAEGSTEDSLNYVMAYLCPDSDQGMGILATHRLLSKLNSFDSAEKLKQSLSKYFEIKEFQNENLEDRKNFMESLNKNNSLAIGLVTKLSPKAFLLVLKNETVNLLKDLPAELQQLDTVVLTNLIFQDVLGLSEEDMNNPDLIAYTPDPFLSFEKILKNESEAAFLLQPTLLQQVVNVAEKALVMPRKSTYFYPKVSTGLIINKIED